VYGVSARGDTECAEFDVTENGVVDLEDYGILAPEIGGPL